LNRAFRTGWREKDGKKVLFEIKMEQRVISLEEEKTLL
jgi:hypothetical protein